jgi:hypothetical protein
VYKFYICKILFFWRNQKNSDREKVIIITIKEEAVISKETTENYQFDKTVFFALATPLLLVACFLVLHLSEIFLIPSLISFILISVFILTLYPIYKISLLNVNKQKRNLIELRKLILVDYKTCKLCGKQLSIKEFYDTNKKVDILKMSKIWNSNFYGLLCCACFENTPSKFWIKLKTIKKLKNYLL